MVHLLISVYMTVKQEDNLGEAVHGSEDCLADIGTWMDNNLLKINYTKTETIVFSSRQNANKIGDFHLKRIQNCAARLITHTHKTEHIAPILLQLHWIPAEYRSRYKILLYTFKIMSGVPPEYLIDLLQ